VEYRDGKSGRLMFGTVGEDGDCGYEGSLLLRKRWTNASDVPMPTISVNASMGSDAAKAVRGPAASFLSLRSIR
jgi:hypothetical protein